MTTMTQRLAAVAVGVFIVAAGALGWGRVLGPPLKPPQAPAEPLAAVDRSIIPKTVPKSDRQPVEALAAHPVPVIRQIPLTKPESAKVEPRPALDDLEQPVSALKKPVDAPKPVAAPPPSRRAQSEPEPAPSNLCTRYGGWKVTTRGGRSWHCVYPRHRR